MKIGIVGSGMIVYAALSIIENINDYKCTALYGRKKEEKSIHELQVKYKIANVYDDLQEFLDNSSYDIVYVGVINSLHYQIAKEALLKGKHVLLEKPFTSTYQEACELVDIAKKNNCFLFEAVMLRYLHNYAQIKESLKDIGPLKLVQCNYSQYSSRYDKYLEKEVLPAFSPMLSGGSLYDINVYNVHFVVGLLGEPKAVHYFANKGYNNIDTSGILVLEYETCKVVCCGAKDSNSPAGVIMQGENGYIHVDSMPSIVRNIKVVCNDHQYEIDKDGDIQPMENEFIQIHNILVDKNYKLAYEYLDNTLIAMKVLEQGRKQAGIKFGDEE